MKQQRDIAAFTLVEIALAVGVIAFALTAIVGLLATGMDSSKASSDDTLIATMTKAVVSDLRQQPFPTLVPSSYLSVASGSTPQPYTTTSTDPVPSPLYFNADGVRLLNSTGALYQCTISLQGDASTMTAPPASGGTEAVNLEQVTLTFQWPVSAGTAGSKKIMYASLAKY